MRRVVLWQMFLSALFGGCTFFIQLGTYLFATRVVHVPMLVANPIAYLFSGAVNFLLARHVTFRGSTGVVHAHALKFFLVAVAGSILHTVIFSVSAYLLHRHDVVAVCIATALVFFWNFILHRQWTFR